MKAENFIELIEQNRFDKISKNGMTLMAERFRELENEAITVTHCCESDSEQLVLFADWLQYNGKWDLPEKQVDNFLKEQKEQT